jgi:predicted ATPase
MKEPLNYLSSSLKSLKKRKPHIHSLRFPLYRNLKEDSELLFEFPITVLLGKNGTNKSSILHALSGSVGGNSIADFWFETKVDAIMEPVNGKKQSVAHRYLNQNGELVECIKARTPRAGSRDYWEPIKPSAVYGFPPGYTRISPLILKVMHLDFRGELTAFDKYFYFPNPQHLADRDRYARDRLYEQGIKSRRSKYSKQDYLRARSSVLKKKIEDEGKSLNSEEVDIIRYVLERNYISGKILKHSLFYGHEGWTILFETSHHSHGYSDAFAGSGESAATLLIHNVLQAPEGSLVLLDEPETSLHPGAQQRLLRFLADQAVKKDLQIVIATHSIDLVRGLPQEAIRVLELDKNSDVIIKTNLSAEEALHGIGEFPHGKTILVEDKRAKHIVLTVLKMASPQAAQEFRVIEREGGTSRLYLDIQAHSHSGRQDVFLIFDGDHRPTDPIPEEALLPQGEKALKDLIDNMTKGNLEKGPKLTFVDAADKTLYINFFKKFVCFLPARTPEQMVWNDDSAKELLEAELPDYIMKENDYKRRIEFLAEEIASLDSEAVFQSLLRSFLGKESQCKTELFDCIKQIRITAAQ